MSIFHFDFCSLSFPLIHRGQRKHFLRSLGVPAKRGVLIVSVLGKIEYPWCHALSPFLLMIETAVDSTGKSIATTHPSFLEIKLLNSLVILVAQRLHVNI